MTIQPVSILSAQITKMIQIPELNCIFGYQAMYRDAVECYDEIDSRISELKSRLLLLYDLSQECRKRLEHWHVRDNCSRHTPTCRNGTCGCSYKDLVQYWSLLQARREQFATIRQLQDEACAYRATSGEIVRRFVLLGKMEEHIVNFAQDMHLLGEINADEWDFIQLFRSNAQMYGTPYEPILTVDTPDKMLAICWNQFGERIALS